MSNAFSKDTAQVQSSVSSSGGGAFAQKEEESFLEKNGLFFGGALLAIGILVVGITSFSGSGLKGDLSGGDQNATPSIEDSFQSGLSSATPVSTSTITRQVEPVATPISVSTKTQLDQQIAIQQAAIAQLQKQLLTAQGTQDATQAQAIETVLNQQTQNLTTLQASKASGNTKAISNLPLYIDPIDNGQAVERIEAIERPDAAPAIAPPPPPAPAVGKTVSGKWGNNTSVSSREIIRRSSSEAGR